MANTLITYNLSGTTLNTNAHTRIGLRAGRSEYWLGQMDEPAIWNKELTQAEVDELYASGIGLQYPFSTTLLSGLTSYYSYDSNA